MKPILKWAGGKSSEIEIIKKHIPVNINRYIEPFLGGGAIYFDFEHKNNIVNDLNKELICFYEMLSDNIKFMAFKKIIIKMDEIKNKINNFTNKDDLIHYSSTLFISSPFYSKYLQRELSSKQKTIKKINNKREKENIYPLSYEDELLNIKTACIGAIYYMYREMYNIKNKLATFDVEHITYWFIMREICYSGMFRFSKNGDFNVPYGGISYNSKNFSTKVSHIEKINKLEFYNNTQFNNEDFEILFKKYHNFEKDDFIFIDPPYDSEFSQYNKEEDFLKNDQIRLRDLLIETPANIMVVIKNTDFIFELYKNYFNIISFDKNYSVNIKNRNKKEVNHLIITNY